MRVLVDVFERESRLVDALHALGVETERGRLPVADYVAGNALVERKSVKDLHLSIVSGRFWPQIGRLSRTARVPYLLVEGERLDSGPLSGRGVRGALIAVSELGIGVIRSSMPDESALWLMLLAKRPARRRPRRIYARRLSADPSVAALAAVPGIAVTVAEALLDQFGSIADLVAAGPEQWLSVEGVGPKRAQALWNALADQRVTP